MAIDGFTKLFSSIVTSTIWSEDSDTRVVWITLLALSDANGFVASTVPGLARLSGVELEVCESALAKFQSPDRYSRSQEHEGRRLRVVDGGFELLNHQKYREFRNEDDRRRQNREAQKRWRERNKSVSKRKHSKPPSAQAEAEAEAETGSTKEPPEQQVFDFWAEQMGHPRARADRKRLSRIEARLKDFTVDELSKAILGAKSDPWLMGTDPKSTRKYDGLEQILRDNAQVERLIELHENGQANGSGSGQSAPLSKELEDLGRSFVK
jgi:hypothetical protein